MSDMWQTEQDTPAQAEMSAQERTINIPTVAIEQTTGRVQEPVMEAVSDVVVSLLKAIVEEAEKGGDA
jgi:hypothetical protein